MNKNLIFNIGLMIAVWCGLWVLLAFGSLSSRDIPFDVNNEATQNTIFLFVIVVVFLIVLGIASNKTENRRAELLKKAKELNERLDELQNKMTDIKAQPKFSGVVEN